MVEIMNSNSNSNSNETNMSLLDDFLGKSLSGGSESDSESESNKIALVELQDGEIDPRYTRLSYSSCQTLHQCPRKFQLQKLMTEVNLDPETSLTFAFGHAVGLGIAELVSGTSLEETLFKMFLGWDVDYLAVNPKQQKSFPHAVHAIVMLNNLMADGYLGEYEVATYNGNPAAELSFCVSIPSAKSPTNFTMRGYLDLVLRHLISGEYGVLENKTSSSTWVNHYQYKNSAQALGYGVILDFIEKEKSSYEVLYNIYMTKLMRYENFPFIKNYHMRALWIRDLIWDVQTIETLVEQEGNYNIWPMRGESCTAFGKVCEYMDICQLETKNLMKPLTEAHYEDVSREGTKVEYDFNIDIGELLK